MCNTPGFSLPPNVQYQQHPSITTSTTTANMNSNVGNPQVYEAGDQRNPKQSEMEQPERYSEGQANAHQNTDSKDERSIKNRLAAAEAADDSNQDSRETQLHKKDPTLPVCVFPRLALTCWTKRKRLTTLNQQAKMHGNEPSRGAKIDAELQAEDEEMLKKKGDSMPGKKN